VLLLREPGQDLANVVDKAHVQHPVCFIENKILDAVEAKQFLIAKIEKTAGCSDENVHAALQGLYLRVLWYTAEYDRMLDIRVAAVGGKAFVYLDRQFPGGGKDQGLDRTGSGARIFGDPRCVFTQQLK